MTVIKHKTRSYSHTRSNSDTESLHILSNASSDIESTTDETRVATKNCSLKFKIPRDKFGLNIRSNCGKRKQRRINNRLSLETVQEENENDISQFVVMPSYESPFSKLHTNIDALEAWNDFINKTEEEQQKILEYSEKDSNKTEMDQKQNSSLKSYLKISAKIRRALKMKKRISADVISSIEDPMITFFKTTPNGIHTVPAISSFQRLLIHGIAQYHLLHSISLFSSSSNYVEVTNSDVDWNCSETSFKTLMQNFNKC